MLTSHDFASVVALEDTDNYAPRLSHLMRMIGQDVVSLLLQNELPLGRNGLLKFTHPARAKIIIFESDDDVASTSYSVEAIWQDSVFRGNFYLRNAKIAEMLDSHIEDCFR